MKQRITQYSLLLITLVLVTIVFGYALNVYSSEKGVKEIIKAANSPVKEATSVDMTVSLPDKVVRVHSGSGTKPFWTETRKDKIERYKCSQCHNNQVASANNAEKIAHGDILLDHGGAQRPLSCFTCHKQDDRNAFETEEGVTVDMDHVYELCGQCHFRQKKDWIGGAHGKRIDHWAGQRVVANCTSCHDPHSPLFKKRWPETYSLPLE